MEVDTDTSLSVLSDRRQFRNPNRCNHSEAARVEEWCGVLEAQGGTGRWVLFPSHGLCAKVCRELDTKVDGRRSGREEGRQQVREALLPTEEDALKASGLG